ARGGAGVALGGAQRGLLDDGGGEQAAGGRLERVGLTQAVLVALARVVQARYARARQDGEREGQPEGGQPERPAGGEASHFAGPLSRFGVARRCPWVIRMGLWASRTRGGARVCGRPP